MFHSFWCLCGEKQSLEFETFTAGKNNAQHSVFLNEKKS